MMDDRELLVEFVEESEEHLHDIEPDLLELEDMGDDVDGEVVNRIFRAVHSMKGASGFFGLVHIGKVSHEMESLLSMLRESTIHVTPQLIDCLLAGIDSLSIMLKDVEGSDEVEIDEVVDLIVSLRTGKSSTSVEKDSVESDSTDSEVRDDNEKENIEPPPIAGFTITNEELKVISRSGKYLFHIDMDSKADFSEKEKPFSDFIIDIGDIGSVIEGVIEAKNISGLKDCLDGSLNIAFIYKTVMDPNLCPAGLDLDEASVTGIDIEHLRIDISDVSFKELAMGKSSEAKSEEIAPSETSTDEVKPKQKSKKSTKTASKLVRMENPPQNHKFRPKKNFASVSANLMT